VTGRLGQSLARGVDTVLDRAVVPGYSKVGYAVRRRSWDPDDPRPGVLRGKVAVVTGASSGLGKATVKSLARLGAVVHLVVRDLQKGGRAADEIRRARPDAQLVLHRCDVSELASVRAFAGALRGSVEHVDVLVHNAGTMPPERTLTSDGHELAFATHVLGPVLMTELLRPTLARSAEARVVLVSSGGMYGQRIHDEDPEFSEGEYGGTAAYARTKRMQVALTPLMQERWAADGVAVHAMHPGWADTPGVVESLPRFHRIMGPLLRDADSGADTIAWLAATQPAPGGGQFWHDRAPRAEHYLPYTRDRGRRAEQLWAYVLDQLSLS
jgi:NAD(P)-dependent dehydrogenase (short-subunit alcohol dehydrogenase family)